MTTIVGPDKLCAGCNFAKARRSGHYCAECLPLVKMVQRNVKRALGTGVIPKWTRCVDCGRGAQVRDHRHYSKPRVFEYVCRTCNGLRGPALDIAMMIENEKRVMLAMYPVDKLVKKRL